MKPDCNNCKYYSWAMSKCLNPDCDEKDYFEAKLAGWCDKHDWYGGHDWAEGGEQ